MRVSKFPCFSFSMCDVFLKKGDIGTSIFQGGSRPSAVEAVVNTVLTEAMLNISGSGGNSQPDQTDCVASTEGSASLTTQEDNFRSVLEALDSALPQMLGMCHCVYEASLLHAIITHTLIRFEALASSGISRLSITHSEFSSRIALNLNFEPRKTR